MTTYLRGLTTSAGPVVLADFRTSGDFSTDPYVNIELPTAEKVWIGVWVYNNASAVSAPRVSLTLPTLNDAKVAFSDVTGDVVSWSDGDVVFANGSPYASAVLIVDRPPPYFQLTFGATAFPSVTNGSFIQVKATWR